MSIDYAKEWNPTPIQPPSPEDTARSAMLAATGEEPTDDEVADALAESAPAPLIDRLGTSEDGDPPAWSVGLSRQFGADGEVIDELGGRVLSAYPALAGMRDLRLELAKQVRDRAHDERVFYGKAEDSLDAAVERAVFNAMGDLLLEVYRRIMYCDNE